MKRTIKVSALGKDFKGNKLDEDNCHGYQPILWEGKLYRSGNRRGYAVELVDCFGQFFRTVNTEEVQLVKLEFGNI